jgi:hypothetical protein
MFRSEGDADARFSVYGEGLASVVGHADRIGPLRDYYIGLILPVERKSVEPMAAKAPARTAAQPGVPSGSGSRRKGKLNNTARPASIAAIVSWRHSATWTTMLRRI